MSNKLIINNIDRFHTLLKGMNSVAEAVASTYGPNGRNVIIEGDDGKPHITKDGVTVANAISFADPIMDMGASLIKDAANKTLKEVGDGTTTTAILANEATKLGLEMLSNLNPFKFRTYLEDLTTMIESTLKAKSIPINTSDVDIIKRVALNSANGNEEIAEKVTQLFTQIGKNGIVFVKNTDILGIHTQVIKGLSIDKGYSSPLFCRDGQSALELENCNILISKKIIRDYKDIIPYLQDSAATATPIILIVPEIDNTVTELFLANICAGVFNGCIIQAPYSHERQDDFLYDLGIASGAITKEQDVNKVFLLGKAQKVIVNRDTTEFIGLDHTGLMYDKHLSFLTDLMSKQSDKFLAEKINERLAMFSGNIGYINIGTATETERLELQDKLDDVIHAVRAALKDGIVPAGGIALSEVADIIPTFTDSYSTLECRECYTAKRVLISLCRLPKELLNCKKVATYDPTAVVCTALKNAISVTGLIITSKFIIINE